MPNRNSKADHKPIRTCVVCKAKREQSQLLSFFMLPEGIVMDVANVLQSRKNYVCLCNECLQGLDKWKLRQTKKKTSVAKRVAV